MTKKTIMSPWGEVQEIIEYRKGLSFYSTAGHGGYRLTKRYNEMIPKEYRNIDGWYEEDQEALKVEYFLADIIQPVCIESIREDLEQYIKEPIK